MNFTIRLFVKYPNAKLLTKLIRFKDMGKFEIVKRKNGEFQFSLKAGNGQVVLTSEGYTTKANCQNGLDSVKKNAKEDSRYEKKISVNQKYYFNLKATNGQIIGSSQMYESEAGRDKGIESVKKNAPDAPVADLSIDI